MDGSHKQHRVKEAKTHMVHKLHDSISIEWKDRQNSVRSQNNDIVLRTAVSVSSSGSRMERSVSLGKSR